MSLRGPHFIMGKKLRCIFFFFVYHISELQRLNHFMIRQAVIYIPLSMASKVEKKQNTTLLCRTLSWNNYKIELISIISWETEVSARYQLHTYTYKFWLPLLTRDSYQKLLFPLSLLFTCCLMPGKETSLNNFFQLVLYSVIFFL